MSFTPIKELTTYFRFGSILARVSRMWDFRGGKDTGELQHVDLVFVDQEVYAVVIHTFLLSSLTWPVSFLLLLFPLFT